jgi:hypothetical protein
LTKALKESVPRKAEDPVKVQAKNRLQKIEQANKKV